MMTPEERQFYTMIGKVIREQIRQDDTQDEIAELLGVGNMFISDVERGKTKISLVRFFELLKKRGLIMTTDGETIQLYKKAGA